MLWISNFNSPISIGPGGIESIFGNNLTPLFAELVRATQKLERTIATVHRLYEQSFNQLLLIAIVIASATRDIAIAVATHI